MARGGFRKSIECHNAELAQYEGLGQSFVSGQIRQTLRPRQFPYGSPSSKNYRTQADGL